MIKKYFTYYLNKNVPYWLIFTIDSTLIAMAFCLTYFIRFNFTYNFNLSQFLIQLPIVLVVTSISFLLTRSFKISLRHIGFFDIINLFKSVMLMTILLGLLILINKKINLITNFTIPLSILIPHSLLSFVLLSFSRIVFKSYFIYLRFNEPCKRVLIYGTGESGIIAYNALINNVTEKFKVVGFIDDSQSKIKTHINGLPIWPETKINKEFIITHGVDEIIISSENIEENNPLLNLKIKTTKIPSIQSWVNGELILNKIKNIKIEDLLGRSPIKINNTNVAKEFIGETLLITGAASSIGRELVNELISFDVKKLILIDQTETDLYDLQQDLKQRGKHNFIAIVADISDSLRIDMLFQEYKPSVVFHAAEYINEQLLEKSPYEAIKININGTKFLADTSSRYNVKKFIFVSSDKAINPTTSIGVTKRLAELYITCLQKESKTKFITTRCGDIVGSKCSIISNFEKQIKNGGPLTISHKEMTRFFMTISEVVELILEAGTMGKGGEIFIFDTGQPIKIYDIAQRMINLYGLDCPKDIDIKITGLDFGEKIQGEYIANIENPVYTYHKKVMIFDSIELNHSKIKSEIEELCFMNRFQHNDIVLKMKQLIPECKPNNSEYDRMYKRIQSYKKTKGILSEKTNKINIINN